MSAFEISDLHIDAMLYAGLTWAERPPRFGMHWQARELTEEEVHGAYEAGEPWGPEAIKIARSLNRELTRDTLNRVGAMLIAENRRSVNHRYNEDELEYPYEYRANFGGFSPDPVTVLKAISCYVYQSCEHPGWEASEAKRFCEALKAHAINHLPGYDEADGWEVRSRDVFRDAAAREAGPANAWMRAAHELEAKLEAVEAMAREALARHDLNPELVLAAINGKAD